MTKKNATKKDNPKQGNPGDGEPAASRKADGFLVVGLGASAGGIQALKEFFENVPPDSGMAYVVILHLSPDHDSKLAEVLQGATEMPVQQVLETSTVEPDRVYVVPPNQHLVCSTAISVCRARKSRT